jgi:DNA processing protein
VLCLTPLDPRYPRELLELDAPPNPLTVSGDLGPPARRVAIVGSRDANASSVRFAKWLGRAAARAGFVVLSGGAAGVDAAAHRGALEAGGRTWVICGTGKNHVSPKGHGALFRRIAAHPGGALVWPFADDAPASWRGNFLRRNGVLVALADVVVVAQAGAFSGALNAAAWARKLGRPLWVASPEPADLGFLGSVELIRRGAGVITTVEEAVAAIGAPAGLTHVARPEAPGWDRLVKRARAQNRPIPGGAAEENATPPEAPAASLDDPDEKSVFSALCDTPQHRDRLVEKSPLPPQRLATALLTLALKDVVVEGPEGFFRRKNGA